MSKMSSNHLFLFAVLISLFLSSSSAQTCSKYAFKSNKVFSTCNDLPTLNSFLHYTYNPSSGALQIAFRHTGLASNRWVAWAINPTSKGMVGSQALIAFQKSDGTMSFYTSSIDSYQTGLQKGDLSFPVSDLSATYANNEMTIFATLQLPNNSSNLNQVWQEGPLSNDSPAMHPTTGANVQSVGSLNLLSGTSSSAGAGGALNSKLKKKNIHGILNTISWGILLPLGAITARYVKVFEAADPAWFYLHAICQTSAYIIGVAGWATGIQLGNNSPGIQQTVHRAIGIAIFCLATLQVFALFLRPKKEHKFRIFWNIYHHGLGYSIIILGIVNIFRGFKILNPEEKWEKAYIGVLVAMAVIAVILEVYTWIVVLRRKKSSEGGSEKYPHGSYNGGGGANGYNNNGYGGRAQNGV